MQKGLLKIKVKYGCIVKCRSRPSWFLTKPQVCRMWVSLILYTLNISIYSLQIVLYTFPKVLTRKICYYKQSLLLCFVSQKSQTMQSMCFCKHILQKSFHNGSLTSLPFLNISLWYLFTRVILTETFDTFPVYCAPWNLKRFNFLRSPCVAMKLRLKFDAQRSLSHRRSNSWA